MQRLVRKSVIGGFVATTLLAAAACGDSSTGPGGEQELISRVTLTLTPSGGGAALTAYIDDPDGLGPTPPSAQVGALTLIAGATYTGTVLFENRLVMPAENITEEVETEAEEHQVYYTVAGNGTTFTVTDVDGLGRDLGLTFDVNAGTAGAGTVTVELCHYGDSPKPASSASCSGDTDVELTFNFTVVAPVLRAGN